MADHCQRSCWVKSQVLCRRKKKTVGTTPFEVGQAEEDDPEASAVLHSTAGILGG